ncbi:calmodulin-binding protein 25-like [Panicum miliaceum]|uniref:Calmodulin-binding protein 25-like n=1 Tax=Panicum miliaceum TaxID=4540 RepID=A0A3L6PG51_PANMI|nr:calmodulin-binding protein 25-like [Panicum miliaceum]
MLMTAAAVHMDSAHGHGPLPSSSTSSPPPWLPVLADRHQLLRELTASSAPSTTPATAAPPNHHHHLRTATAATATRRVAKRRPRPSRKLPTTYIITADPASFRRMVHQVTGADGLLPVPPEALCRPEPYRAGAAGPAGALMLPTLDTSAFLLGAPGVAAPAVDRAEAGGPAGVACNYSSSCGGFPTLDSWDALF